MVVLILFRNFAGMKRLLHIFPVLVLSLLIVAMSAGLSVEVCMHSGRAEVVQIAEAQGNHDCHGMKGCMVVKTIKQNWVAIMPTVGLFSLAHTFISIQAPSAYVPIWCSPPREYLHQLRVLRL